MMHKFEEAGLGVAPFRFVAVEEKWFTIPGTGIRKPGAACDYCGTAIVECCWIRDANGKRFKVGNECVRKTGDAGLFDTVKKALNAKRREARAAKLVEDRKEALALLAHPTVVAALGSRPHPNEYFASTGKTELDYLRFVIERVNSDVPAALKRLRVLAIGEMAVDADAIAKAAALAQARAEAESLAAAAKAAEEAARAAAVAANAWLVEALMPYANFDSYGYATNFFGSMVKELETGRAVDSLPAKAQSIIASKVPGFYDRRDGLVSEPAPAPAAPATPTNLGSFQPVIAMFELAAKNLKFPAFNLMVEGQEVKLYRAGAKSKVYGNVMVVTPGAYGQRSYYGTITPEGEWKPGRDAESRPAFLAALTGVLTELAVDPHAVVAKYGNLTGHCCFCHLTLSDARSTAAGYGPICAERWGLAENWKNAAKAIAPAEDPAQPALPGMSGAQKAWATRRARAATAA
jgi:hypothetical protein